MDSLKFHPAPPCPTLQHPVGGPPLKRSYSQFKSVACPQGGWSAAVLGSFKHPTPSAYGKYFYVMILTNLKADMTRPSRRHGRMSRGGHTDSLKVHQGLRAAANETHGHFREECPQGARPAAGKFHDQGDAEWIVSRRSV
jgi:hypothetical protein